MSDDNITVKISYTIPKFTIPKNIEIEGSNDDNFWDHHGNRKLYEQLRENIVFLPEIIDKWVNKHYEDMSSLEISPKQKQLINSYITQPVKIEYDNKKHIFQIRDGRHRIKIGLERQIAIPARMYVSADFEKTHDIDKKAEYYALTQPEIKTKFLTDLIYDEQAYFIKDNIRHPVTIVSSKEQHLIQSQETYRTEQKLPFFRSNKGEYYEH